jgi:energy-coupling factor transporter ATP-binding protein EcfA2
MRSPIAHAAGHAGPRAPVFEARGLTKVYPMGELEVQALRGVDFDLYEGEMLVLLGPSGSGKSTLLNILGGLDTPTAGRVVYRGQAVPTLRGGYLFADYCSGTLWAIDAGVETAQAPVTLLETGSAISSISTGEDGEVYLTDLSRGRVLRLVAGS